MGIFIIGKGYISSLADEANKLPSGEEAIKVMSVKEKDFLENKILKIKEHMTSNEVKAILGPQYKIGPNVIQRRLEDWLCPEWDFLPDSNQFNCLIKGYFVDDKIVAIDWIKLDHFFYQIKWEGY